MNLERLLEKLEAEADESAWLKRRQAAVQLRSKAVFGKPNSDVESCWDSTPPTRAETNIKKISELRRKTDAARFELETNKQLAEQTKLYQDARLALYVSNLTLAQKQERDDDAYRMGMWASQYCKDASPSWREDAAETCKNRKLF